jgi:hypothetical protein
MNHLRDILFGCGLLSCLPAVATQWVVVESNSERYQAGSTLDGTTTLSLPTNMQLLLTARSGVVLELAGPFNGVPDDTPDGSNNPLYEAIGLSIGGTRSLFLQKNFSWPLLRSTDGVVRIPAGVLNGITSGSLFSVRSGKTGKEITQARAAHCRLTVCELSARDPLPSAAHLKVRLTGVNTVFPLHVYVQGPPLREWFDGVRQRAQSRVGLDFVERPEAAGVVIKREKGRLWLMQPSEAQMPVNIKRHFSIRLADDIERASQNVIQALQQISRATWLMSIEGTSSDAIPERFTKVSVTSSTDRKTDRLFTGTTSTYNDGDSLSLELEAGRKPRLFMVYYLDSHYNISRLFPNLPITSAELQAGDARPLKAQLDSMKTAGLEHLLVFVSDKTATVDAETGFPMRKSWALHFRWRLEDN